MTACLRKSCYVSFVNVYQFACVVLSLLVLWGVWDLSVLIPDHCLSIYFETLVSLSICELRWYEYIENRA